MVVVLELLHGLMIALVHLHASTGENLETALDMIFGVIRLGQGLAQEVERTRRFRAPPAGFKAHGEFLGAHEGG